MGKQKGDAARSKARPSSSSLAASLVPSGSTATVGFGGYVGGSRLEASLPSEDSKPYADVDSELALHLKRLARKDPTTKLKALASLSALLKEKSPMDITPIIPQWAFEYKKLVVDYNRDVRRATHDTMNNLVTAVGRDLAPHLKSLMGPWWFSQFDRLSEVAQAAKRSLQAAFPAQEKRLDALILCTAEVFTYLEENLRLTPQSMSEKATAIDELEEMHQQVISSSILALATLLDVLVCKQEGRTDSERINAPPKHALKARETAISFAEKLFTAHKYFIDFLKSPISAIRSATYSVLSSFIRNIPHAFSEGNMKTLAAAVFGAFQETDPACHSSMWDAVLLFSKRFPDSWTSINVQKVVLNRFWNFLRNGCFGSQQISYPALLPFLDTVPSKAVVGETFLLEFFQNLWAGRNPSHSLNADRLAFLGAFKDCFLWGLRNASRYCDKVDSISHFQVNLVKNVLVKLLWREYHFASSSKHKEKTLSRLSADSCESGLISNEKTVVTLNIMYPMSYLRELGNCIVGILSGIYSLEHDLLSAFSAGFEENCLGLFNDDGKLGTDSEHAERIIQFISLLGEHAMQKGQSWPLGCLVGPMLSKSFPLMRSHDSPNCVKILSVAVSVFGPRKIVQELLIQKNLSWDHSIDMGDKETEADLFMQIFKEKFVPWCLHGNSCSLSARLDLLFSLLDDEYFSEQWDIVIRYVTALEHSGCATSLDSDHITILSMLLEKARDRIASMKEGEVSMGNPENWHHELLESAAVSVAHSPPSGTCNSQFLCTVVGGSTKSNQTSFVSRNTLILIFEEVFKKLLSFILASSFTWVRNAGPLLSPNLLTAVENYSGLEYESSVTMFEMAQFALGVLDGALFSLKKLGEESGLVPGILSAVFIIDWEFLVLLTTIDDAPHDESREKLKARLGFGESFHAFRCKISNQFWKSLGLHNRQALGNILIQSMRSAIFIEDKLDTEKFTSLCCLWMLEVLDCVSQDQYEEQNLLDQLLCKGDSWPLWIVPDFSSPEGLVLKNSSADIQDFGHRKFVSFIYKIISEVGIDRVVAGHVKHSLPPCQGTTNEGLTRSWLACEILCTWRWPGGSAVSSFLPSLSAYAKSRNYSSQESLLDFIFNILLDGALIHGGCDAQSFVYLWPASNDEVEDIEEPLLRALVAVLFTLFNDNIWEREKAVMLFELLVNKLCVGEAINANCLRILPLIVNVLIRPLSQRSIKPNDEETKPDSSGENRVQDIIEGWLQKAISFPPLITWQTGQDMEDWLQLVIACYPFSTLGDIQTPKLERNVSSAERTLLLELFRKQRGPGTSTVINQLPVVQTLLSRLMVISVGYCWKEFNEEDWEFVLSQLRRWIQSAVVMMEEIAENINDIITSRLPSDNLDSVLNKLGKIVYISDSFTIDIAKNALLSFSLCCGPFGLQQAEDADTINPLRTERWDPIKDRILEGILRLFFCTGIAEAIARSCCDEAASLISSSRSEHSHFWELVASSVVNSSTNARDRAVKSIEFWGLSKGAISALYAILFSSKPVPLLQFAAYSIISSEPVLQFAIVEDKTSLDSVTNGEEDSSPLDISTETSIHLKEEISCMIEKLPYKVLEMDLVAEQRVHVFLAWSLLLSHLWSLPSSSPARERLVQYIQDSASSVILDCLFQHIPLELCMAPILKKKDAAIPAGIAEAATAATHAIKTGSVLFSVQSLWPVEPVKIASVSGAMFGLMLRILPAYVRQWFSDLRDRSTSSAIESFTRSWCSPPLITNELSLIKKDEIADENFSIIVSKSANEVVATYTKDETGLDLVIRLPSSYPLRPVDVDCRRSLGISEVKQRKWLMSMASFVRNQNGALAEAIKIWKRNFDKEFEGVEECPICYSVIHTANHSLPRLACKTCKHKFHSACLFKWFSTSHKSTCPLCQSPF
ncbi:E3 ubiquitin-protein ligase listerin [Malus sylvestris]|uniref:E3 ubiquitin-protein ligase listerin n=1 Tax=Malus sylvestris TaxID=3752 RepID=UPI0021ABBF34|nr:E3 ubiquitin-protein ligase listerin [Malus sylvestris]